MSTQPSPWLTRCRELLADGLWHDEEKLLAELISLVPPGRAIRQREKDRKRNSAARGSDTAGPERFPRSREWQIRTGARRIVRMSLFGSNHKGQLERMVGPDGRKLIRLASKS